MKQILQKIICEDHTHTKFLAINVANIDKVIDSVDREVDHFR